MSKHFLKHSVLLLLLAAYTQILCVGADVLLIEA